MDPLDLHIKHGILTYDDSAVMTHHFYQPALVIEFYRTPF